MQPIEFPTGRKEGKKKKDRAVVLQAEPVFPGNTPEKTGEKERKERKGTKTDGPLSPRS